MSDWIFLASIAAVVASAFFLALMRPGRQVRGKK